MTSSSVIFSITDEKGTFTLNEDFRTLTIIGIPECSGNGRSLRCETINSENEHKFPKDTRDSYYMSLSTYPMDQITWTWTGGDIPDNHFCEESYTIVQSASRSIIFVGSVDGGGPVAILDYETGMVLNWPDVPIVNEFLSFITYNLYEVGGRIEIECPERYTKIAPRVYSTAKHNFLDFLDFFHFDYKHKHIILI